MNQESEYSALSHSFATLTAVATLFLILVGGLVTSNDAGLSVPDWPLSFGKLMPEMVGGVFYEHGHRMVATTVGFLTILLAVILWRLDPRAWVRKLGGLALLTVIVQGVLGGLTVIFRLPPLVSVLHACLAQTFFCILVILVVVTSRWWLRQPYPKKLAWHEPRFRMALWTTLGVYLQLIFGAAVRHAGTIEGAKAADFVLWALVLHLAGAFLVSLLVLLLVMNLLKELSEGGLVRTAYALVLALVVQLALGVAAYAVRMDIAAGGNHQPAVAVLPTIHVAIGALILATCLGMTLVISRGAARRRSPVSLGNASLAGGGQP